MAVSFITSGTLATNATTTTLGITAPACNVNDILIAVILGKDNQVITVPDGTWTKFIEVNNTVNQRITVAWKRATGSGGTFNFTKPTDNNILFCGLIAVYRGCITSATPIDATTPTNSPNASSDTVTYATFNPTETNAFVVAIGVYNDDATTAGSISGTDPTFSLNFDEETNIGTDGSIFGYSGSSSGAATGARSHSTTSGVDAINIGVMFGLVAAAGPAAGNRTLALTGAGI